MNFSSSLDPPISKLDRDLLWNIFTINVTDNADFFYPLVETHRSPLTTTRRCSQVCTFWREIILESPSIWGNCIDLDALVQGNNDWRNEVLRRTGNALLSVRACYDNAIVSGTALHRFLVDLIHGDWARIHLFDVAVESNQTLNDARVWSAFIRPARYLKEFSIHSVEFDSNDTITLPAGFCLFSNDAPLLTHFSLQNCHRIILPLGVRPFPSVFLTTQLQSLSLHQPMELAATDLLIACEQMPSLEELAIAIRKLIPGDKQDALLSSTRRVTLPRLQTIDLTSPNLEIYSAFLARIATHPGCTLNIETILDETEAQATQTVATPVQEMQRVFSQFSNALFDHHRDGTYPVTDLSLTLLSGFLEFSTYHHRFSLRLLSAEGDHIPNHILDSVFLTISTLRFPSTIGQLNLFIPSQQPRFTNIILEIFLVLSSVTVLVTAPPYLSYLAELSKLQTSTVFPLLKTVFLRSLGFQNQVEHIKPFLADRQRTSPVEVLDFSKAPWPLGDLRFLDELTGLKVVWVQDNVSAEYICGSGNPKKLLLGSDDVDKEVSISSFN